MKENASRRQPGEYEFGASCVWAPPRSARLPGTSKKIRPRRHGKLKRTRLLRGSLNFQKIKVGILPYFPFDKNLFGIGQNVAASSDFVNVDFNYTRIVFNMFQKVLANIEQISSQVVK